MSKKNVLNEVRRFMKLANLDASVSSNFVNKLEEMEKAYMRDEKDMMQEEEAEEEMEMDMEVEEEPMMGDEEIEMDMEVEMEADEEAVLTDEEAAILIALGQKLAAAQEMGAEEEVEDAMDDLEDADEMEAEAEDLEDDAAEDLADAAEDLAEEDSLEEILDSVLEEEEEMEEGMHGGNKGDKSKTHPGEKDYTTKKGEKLKHSGAGRGEKKGDEAYVNEDLVQEVLKRVRERLAAMSKE